MITKINTLGLEGINPVKIETEVDISPGFPRFGNNRVCLIQALKKC